MRGRILGVAAALLLLCGTAAWANGQITGKITTENGKGIGGVSVIVSELGLAELTDNDGLVRFSNIPPGSYTLTLSQGDNSVTETIAVEDGATTTFETAVPWNPGFIETITVTTASRRRERIVDAPAAVTSVSEEQIEREASHGQVPKLLEFTPGVQTTQSGVYDFNLNTRGFNSSLNRRVVVLVDGRDPSVPFLASQEWVTVSQYMNDLQSAEMVRGPSSALYGKNAFNGVLNLVTKSPRDHVGGEIRLTAGELSTSKAELRWVADLGNDWFLKLNGSFLDGGDFSQDRTLASGVEYAGFCTAAGQTDCLAPEVRPRLVEDNQVFFGNLRLDKYLQNGDFLTIEGGTADAEAPALQTGIGRFSLPSVERFWGRFNYTSRHWNFLSYLNDRQGDEQTSLQSGATTFLDSQNYHFEVQTNWDWNEGKVRLVAGASHREEEISTANNAGVETLLFAPVDSDSQAAYAQLDFDVSDNVKIVLAGRYDESTLHDSQVSPKASLVWSLNANNTLRFSYNEAFQVANYSEFFLQADAAPPANLSPFEGFCAAAGVDCGFGGLTRVLAVGNDSLEVEEVESFEFGYSGIIGGKAFLTFDYYSSELTNFITDLLPNVGTELGRLNSDFGPYQAPAALPAPLATALLQALQGALGPTFFALSNNFDGDPIIVGASYTNFGQVDTQGVELGLNVFLNPQWRINTSYSWFDFDVKNQLTQDPLEPNAPENAASFGLSYVTDKFDIGGSFRWSDEYRWVVGTLFRGDVPSFETVDLTANYRVNENWQIGVNVSNLFDDEHFEAFGGDLIGRRALGHVAFSW